MFALSTLFGLPAHALLVHGAVVLVPLAALALITTGWKQSWRRAYSFPSALLAVGGMAFAFLAQQTGEPLKHAIRDAAVGQQVNFGEHPDQGNTAFLFAIALGLTAVGFWAVDRYGERWNLPKWTALASYGVVVVVAMAATTAMVIAGHSGAILVWRDVGTLAHGQ
ncbi:MAG: DUF2231 domain-containing protein [Tepidiformaceae bacterium]